MLLEPDCMGGPSAGAARHGACNSLCSYRAIRHGGLGANSYIVSVSVMGTAMRRLLLTERVPGVLQVLLPASIRGVNEISEVFFTSTPSRKGSPACCWPSGQGTRQRRACSHTSAR